MTMLGRARKSEVSLEYYLKKVEERNDVIPENKIHIANFLKHVSAEIGLVRLDFYYHRLSRLSYLLGMDFAMASEDNIRALVRKLDTFEHKKGCKYQGWSKTCIKVALKRFYKWLEGNDEEYPKKVRWIKAAEKSYRTKKPEELLTESEVWELVKAAKTPRDKAFIFVLYEAGCRPHELLKMRIRHIEFTNYGIMLTVPSNTKTGLRKIPIVKAYKHIKTYLENHPLQDNPEAPLWISRRKGIYQEADYYTMVKQIRIAAESISLKKKVNPYVFRHSRATHLSDDLKEPQMKQYFGWAASSNMPGVYIHLSAKDLEDSVLKMHGISSERIKEEKKDFILCSRCGKEHLLGSDFCSACGMPLELRAIIKQGEERKPYDDKMDEFIRLLKDAMESNPEFRKTVERIGDKMRSK